MSAKGDRPNGAPMRILLVSNMWPSERSSVFGSFVERQVRGLRDAGARVTVVANDDPRPGRLRALRKYAALSRRARAQARRGSFDIVVGHYLYPTAAFARAAARIAGVPYVLVSHGTDARSVMRDDRFGRAGRAALAQAALVVAVSNSLRDTLRTQVAVPSQVPIEVVNMGFDGEAFAPDPAARDRLRIKEGDRVVVFAGNLVEIKGVDVLLKAFERLLDTGAADRLVLIGGGPLESTVKGWVEAFSGDLSHADPTNRVTMTGQLPQRDLALWMAAADVFALPSRDEGLGLVLLEAMACATPCVASKVGGIPELVDESCGRLVPPDDARSLAEAIAWVLASGKDTFGAACIERAASHTSSAKAVEFLGHLEKVVERT